MADILDPIQDTPKATVQSILGGGELGNLIRGYAWDSTLLGPISEWSLSLRMAVNLILQSPTPMVMLWGEAGTVLYNDAYRTLAGQRHPFMLGVEFSESWPETAGFIKEVISQTLQGKALTYRKLPFTVYRNNTAEDIWLDLDCSPILGDDGLPAGTLIITNEITGKVKADQALIEHEERLGGVLNQNSVGIAECDLTGRFILVNDRYSEMVGRSKEALYQMRMQDISHQEDLPHNMVLLKEAIQTGVPFSIEKRYLRPDGTEIWVHNNVSIAKNSAGVPSFVVAVCHEVTEKKLAEKHQKLFLAMSENSSNFIGIADTDGKVIYVNPSGRRMVGLDSPEEAQNTTVIDYFSEEDQPFVREVILPAQTKEGFWKGEFRFRNFKTGQYIEVDYNQFAVKDPSTGEVLGIATVSPDITARKRAEAALTESEERFRTMAEASGLLIAQTDLEGNAIYFNQEWIRLTGRTLEELLNYGWGEFLHPDDRQGFIEAYQNAFKKREVLQREFRLLNKEGEYRWQYAVVMPRFASDQTFAGYMSSCVDVTESKKTQEALVKSEEWFKTFANNLQSLAWTANPDGWITWYNQRWYDFTGSTFEEMQSRGWEKIHHPDHLERVVNFVQEAWTKQETWELIFPLKGVSGEYRWFLTRGIPVKDEEGNLVRWVGTNTDITEQKKAEAELSKFKIISDYAFDAFILMRKDGTFAYLNDLALKRWGYTQEEALTLRLPDVNPIYQEELFNATFAQAQEQGALPPFETLHKRKDGTIYPVEISMGGITLDGQPHLFAVARDITERKQAEETLKRRNEELQRTNNDLDNFIYTASHDLKAPITNIEGLVNTLVMDLPPDVLELPEIAPIISLIGDSISRFKNTINDLTELTKLQRQSSEDVSIVPFQEVLNEICQDLKDPIHQSGATLEIDFGQYPALQFSRKNLRSVLYNLVSNAIKYRSPQRSPLIRITSRQEQDACILTVEDNGLGIEASQQNKLFAMFKRLHDHVEGTGIGLYIVKKIIDNSGGQIEVESEIGRGTTFKVSFKL
ncbi:PAS domain S-box protein [Rufibacter hautae]|uniref:histidine kinase n=1 Tax=Rufibacter hautae TaxID=2595005 RepID=A0A5B6TA49_9BACT|nr:PAS domain S-box protein [Rufibacter hautae]KAA3436815.1 PAS domain S-box protein [Rufibacter hautae]